MRPSLLSLIFSFHLVFSMPAAAGDDELTLLATWMTGTFSSEAQAAEDEDFYNISLIMMPIWTDRTDGYWFYVEQAVATSLDKPYRQRVYHVRRGADQSFESAVFTLANPEEWIGAWKSEQPLAKLAPEDLEERTGCTVVLRFTEDHFAGGTTGKQCHSTLRGASYATSEITIYPDRLVSWDRGFDADDAHIWGAEKGGYVFIKKPN